MQSSADHTKSLRAAAGAPPDVAAAAESRPPAPRARVPAGTYHDDELDDDYCDIDVLEWMLHGGQRYVAHRGYFYVPIEGVETPVSCVRQGESAEQFAARARLLARFAKSQVRARDSLRAENT